MNCGDICQTTIRKTLTLEIFLITSDYISFASSIILQNSTLLAPHLNFFAFTNFLLILIFKLKHFSDDLESGKCRRPRSTLPRTIRTSSRRIRIFVSEFRTRHRHRRRRRQQPEKNVPILRQFPIFYL